jgi:hypothetical protein
MTTLLTPEQAAARIGVCAKTLRAIRQRGAIRYVAVTPRKIFYRPEDCDAYLEACVRVETAPPPTNRKRGGRRLPVQANVVSFTARRQERIAARGR